MPKSGRTETNEAQSSQGSAKNNNIGNCITLKVILAFSFKIQSVSLSGLVLICNFLGETFFPSSCLPATLLLQDNPKFLKSHIFSLRRLRTVQRIFKSRDDGEDTICGLETVEPQEILIKVCVSFTTHCQISYIKAVQKKASFLATVLIYPNVQLQADQWRKGYLVCYFPVSVVLSICQTENFNRCSWDVSSVTLEILYCHII